MLSAKSSRTALAAILMVGLVMVALAVPRANHGRNPDLVRQYPHTTSPVTGHGGGTLDRDVTQMRYVKTTDFGVSWSAITAAGDLETFSPTVTGLADFSAVVMDNNELCYAVPLHAAPATPGVYAMAGPDFTPHLIMAEGSNHFNTGSTGAGWSDIGRCVNGDLLVIIWGRDGTNTHTVWASRSQDHGVNWSTPFVIGTEPALRDSCYPHIADMNPNDVGLVVFQKQQANGKEQFICRFPTAGGNSTITSTGNFAPSNVNQPSYYIGANKPIAYDPAYQTNGILYICYRNQDASGTGVDYSTDRGTTFTHANIPGAQRYPAMALRTADQTPFVTSNIGIPTDTTVSQTAWISHDNLGYGGGDWSVPDQTFGVTPQHSDGSSGPALYINQAYFWDATHGVGSHNYWWAHTPNALWANYTTDGGATWTSITQLWDFEQNTLDASTLANCELVGGSNGVAYIITTAKVGTTDTEPASFLPPVLLSSPAAPPFVVRGELYENNYVDPAQNVDLWWWNTRTDTVEANGHTVLADSFHVDGAGSGQYWFTFNPTGIQPTDTIWFYTEAVDYANNYSASLYEYILGGVWADVKDPTPDVAHNFSLAPNYPNPFNPSTQISFELANASRVNLRVFNSLGQQVAVLANDQSMTAGKHTLTFDASSLPSGIYFYQLRAGQFTATRKMILMK